MDKVLTTAGDLENIAADRKGHDLLIFIIQNQSHGEALNAFVHDRQLSPNGAEMVAKIVKALGKTPETATQSVIPAGSRPEPFWMWSRAGNITTR